MSYGKKLVNSPSNAVDEALAGLAAVHPGLALLREYRTVLRADIDRLKDNNQVQ